MKTQSLALPDGRNLAWCEYGAAQGYPMIFMHGAPGSRLTHASSGEIARELGFRVIAPDRPGFGLSDVDRGRTLISWADDVAALAGGLGFERFIVAGKSAGAPHAAACGWRMPRQVTATVLISSPPPAVSGAAQTLSPPTRRVARMARRTPSLLRLAVAALALAVRAAPNRTLGFMTARLSEADKRLLAHAPHRDSQIAEYVEGYRQGGTGHYQDLLLLTHDWGFHPAEIPGQVFFWHGCSDNIIPLAAGRLLESLAPQARLTAVQGGGHLLQENPQHWKRILEQLRVDLSL